MSEAIDDMHAYTHLTDHTLHQILVSTDPNLEEVKASGCVCLCVQQRTHSQSN